jgi:hypothetical protein
MCISHIATCQSTYFKKINNKVTQNHIFSVGEDIIVVNLKGKRDFAEIANLGKGDSVLWAKKIHNGGPVNTNDNLNFYAGIGITLYEGIFYSGQTINIQDGPIYKKYIYVAKMSTRGDTLGGWKIAEESLGFQLLHGADIAVYENKICISATISYWDNHWQFVSALLWFDMEGHHLDTSIISEGDAYNWSGLLKIGYDGNLYWLTSHNASDGKDRYFYYQLSRFDKSLQHSNVWQSQRYSNTTVNPDMEFTMLKDGGFVMTTTEIEKMFTTTLLRYDKNGALVWENTFSDEIKMRRFKGALELQNGDLLLYGYYHDYTHHIGAPYGYFIEAAPHLCRMSSTGDMHWERTYIDFVEFIGERFPTTYNFIGDVLELPDGTLYIGTVDPRIALKTDENGCIKSNCKRFHELIH